MWFMRALTDVHGFRLVASAQNDFAVDQSAIFKVKRDVRNLILGTRCTRWEMLVSCVKYGMGEC